MDAARWERSQELFHQAFAVPEAERAEFVRRAAGDDPALAAEVLELLDLAGDEPQPRGAGNYRLVRQVGEGFSAWVFEAVQLSIGRTVAFKVQKPRDEITRRGSDATYDALARRFDLEARVLGILDHPGIVPIYDVGRDERGRRGFAMRLVQGENFASVIARTPRGAAIEDVLRAVEVLANACETLAFAHARGIVHRDLKPAHLMSGLFGEAYVIDWGLAGRAGEAIPASERMEDAHGAAADPGVAELTIAGTALGTPGYMPPEQARGERSAIGPASDVYALGAILYHLLSGRRPYADAGNGLDAARFLRDVADGPPVALDEIAPSAPADLRAISALAMARDPSRRYAHAGEMARDLRAFLAGRPIRARPGGIVDRALRFARRRPAVVAIALLVLVALAAGGRLLRDAPLARAEREEQALESAWARLAYSDFDGAESRFAELEDVPEAESGGILCAILDGRHAVARERLARVRGSGASVPGMRWLEEFLDLQTGATAGQHEPPVAAERDAFAAFLRGWTTLRRVRADDLAADGVFALPRGEIESRTARVEQLEDALRDLTNAVDFAAAPRRIFHFGRIRAALLLRRFEDAERSAEALLFRWPESAVARTWAGLAEFHVDPERGRATLRSAEARIADDANSPATRLTLAFVMQAAGARADAERVYRLALAGADAATAARVHANLAMIALEDDRPESARTEAQRAIELDPGLRPAWIHRANALHALGLPDAEREAWRGARARFPDDGPILAASCGTLLDAVRSSAGAAESAALLAEALDVARSAADRFPDEVFGDAFLLAARDAFAVGRSDAGHAILLEWCTLRPREARALSEAAWQLVCRLVEPADASCPPESDPERALLLTTRMLELPGERDHLELDTHAAALLAGGRLDEAAEFARRALDAARSALERAEDDDARESIVEALEAIAERERAIAARRAPR